MEYAVFDWEDAANHILGLYRVGALDHRAEWIARWKCAKSSRMPDPPRRR